MGEVIKRFEGRGYKLVGLKVLVPSRTLAGKHYAEHEGKPFYPKLVDFLSSGAVVAMVFEGKDIVATGRKMVIHEAVPGSQAAERLARPKVADHLTTCLLSTCRLEPPTLWPLRLAPFDLNMALIWAVTW